MGIKARGNGKYDVELRGRHVKRVDDESTARMLFYSGRRQLELGKPLADVIAELRGGNSRSELPRFSEHIEPWLASQRVADGSIVGYRNAAKRAEASIGRMKSTCWHSSG